MRVKIADLKMDRWAYADSAWARIAALVPLVKACAGDGDLVARKVLDDAVYELACSVKAIVDTLKLSGRGAPFTLLLNSFSYNYPPFCSSVLSLDVFLSIVLFKRLLGSG